MIQRIQSIWLFLATIALILMLFLPLLTVEVKTTETSLHTMGLYEDVVGRPGVGTLKEAFTPLFITNVVIALLCFVNIFNFKRRKMQKRIAIVSVLLILTFSFWCTIFAEKLPGGLANAHFDFAAYLPALSILFCIFGIAGINKDEKLIRSAERLR
ncbi:amino acid transporter [Pedobacter sp. UYEF25]